MRQPADDRALYYRQLRATVAAGLPAPAHDAVGDRRGGAGRPDPGRVHRRGGVGSRAERRVRGRVRRSCWASRTGPDVSPERFHELRRQAADVVAAAAGSDEASERERAARLVDVERRFLERVDELRRDLFAERVEAAAGDGRSVSRVFGDGGRPGPVPAPPLRRLARTVRDGDAGRPGWAFQGDDPRHRGRHRRGAPRSDRPQGPPDRVAADEGGRRVRRARRRLSPRRHPGAPALLRRQRSRRAR